MTEIATAPAAPATRSWRWVALPVVLFALVSLTAGLLAHHEPRSKGYFRLFFSDPIHLKAGFATAAGLLACFQVFSAAWIFRKLPWRKPAWINPAHRWSGRLAFLFTLPVAYHCIFKLGFRSPDGRVLAHSLFGCAVYGGYAAKVTIVRLHRFPRFVLPVAGSLLFAILIGVWYTSALWLYRGSPGTAPAARPPAAARVFSSPGAKVFATAGCGACHRFKAAGSTGAIGPDLDRLKPTFAAVKLQVERGGGVMPSYRGTLTPAQIRDVARYVSSGG